MFRSPKIFLLTLALLLIFFGLQKTASAATVTGTIGTGATHAVIGSSGSLLFTTGGGVNTTMTIFNTASGNSSTSVSLGAFPAVAVAATSIGSKIYTANSLADTVSIINTASGNSVSTLSVGDSPSVLAVIGNKLYVGNKGENTITIIDTGNGNSRATTTVQGQPSAFLVASTTLYSANQGSSTLAIIDTANGNSVTTVGVGALPFDIARIGTKIYVTGRTADAVTVVDTANGNSTSSIPVSASPQYIVALGTKLFVSHLTGNIVSIIDTANGNSVTTVGVGAGVSNLFIYNTDIYVANGSGTTISIIHTANNNAVTSIAVGTLPKAITMIGTKLYSVNGSRTVSIIDPADVSNPVVSVTVPTNGATVSGPAVTLTASSSDDDITAGVQFYADGVPIGSEVTSTSTIFTTTWNASLVSNGSHTIAAVARDPSNKYATSTISVTVNNIVEVAITAPTSNAIVTGSTVTLSANATSSVTSLAGVRFLVDGVPIGSEITSAPYTMSWNSTAVSEGNHSIIAVARNQQGDYATSSAINVVSNNQIVVALTSPATTTQFRSSITLTATSSDSVGVVGVQFKINGINVGTEDTSSPYSVAWSTSGLPDGTYVLTATARSVNGFTATATQNIILDKTHNVAAPVSITRLSKMISSGNTVYVLDDFGGPAVYALDYTTNTIATTSGTGIGPTDLLMLGSKLFVSNGQSDSVSIIDTANGNSSTTVNVGDFPSKMISIGTKIYVMNQSSNSVSIIDSTNNSVSTVSVGVAPQSITAIGTKVYVTNSGNNFVSVIDTANGNSVSTISLGESSYKIVALGTKLYVSSGSGHINIIDTANGNSVSTIQTGGTPSEFSVVGSKIYASNYNAGTISIIDTANGNATSSVVVGANPASSIALGTKLYITNGQVPKVADLYILDMTNNSTSTYNLPAGGTVSNIHATGSKVYITTDISGYVHIMDVVLPDSLPPIIVLNATSTTASTATITWTTDEAATSTLEYGLSTGYGSQVISSGTTVHSVVITGLIASSTYHYRIIAQDLSGNIATTSDITFMTTGSPTLPTVTTSQNPQVGFAPVSGMSFGTTQVADITKESQSEIETNVVRTQMKFGTDLMVGMNNDDVMALQKFFNKYGFMVARTGAGSPGNETKIFGSATKAAVMRFQRAKKIQPVNGRVGPKTRFEINKMIETK